MAGKLSLFLSLSLSPSNGGKKRLRRSIIRLFSRVRARLSVTVVVGFSTNPSTLLDEFRAVEIFLHARFSRVPCLFPLSLSPPWTFLDDSTRCCGDQRSVSVVRSASGEKQREKMRKQGRWRKGRKSPRAMEARGEGGGRGKGESEEKRGGGWTIRRNQGFVKRRSRAPEWVVMRGERITLKTSEGRDGTREEWC